MWTILPIPGLLDFDEIQTVGGTTIHVGGRRTGSPTHPEECAMYLIREVLYCKPGKVRPMVEKFRALSKGLEEMGREPLRLLTDVSGEPFWTIVAEAKVERIEEFFTLEEKLMANENLREVMADYHDLVKDGRREIYRIER
jgi:hypothetical protein